MTNRTVQIWGQGYSTPTGAELSLTPCSITATFNGTQVFSGVVPTIESSDVGRLPSDQQVLFTFPIPVDFPTGSYPMTLEITGADVYMEQILANYCNVANTSGNVTTYHSSGWSTYLPIFSSDARSNVTCVGASGVSSAPTDPREPGQEGTWGWEVETASGQTSTFSYDLNIDQGVDVTP
jgi:hypothetical protein